MGSTSRKGASPKAGASGARGRTAVRSERVIDKAALVNKLLCLIERRFKKDELKATLGDFIRLLQLQKELEEEQPKEIEVRWVEPAEPGSAIGG
jgi:hypothetical protein